MTNESKQWDVYVDGIRVASYYYDNVANEVDVVRRAMGDQNVQEMMQGKIHYQNEILYGGPDRTELRILTRTRGQAEVNEQVFLSE